MTTVLVSIGSNIDRRRNIRGGLESLQAEVGDLFISPIYETPAQGFEGDDFYNLVAGFDSEQSPRALNQLFKAIEARHGRERGDQKFAPRTLDIDLLIYGDQISNEADLQLPRNEIERYSFVLQPLADLAPLMRYPGREETFSQLWRRALTEKRMTPGRRVTLDN